MNEHNVLQKISNTQKFIKNISLEDILNVVKTIKQELNLKVFLLLEYL